MNVFHKTYQFKSELVGYAKLVLDATCLLLFDIISYPLFADADTEISPPAASQYQARPKVKRGIAMLSAEKLPYPRKQTRVNEFIPCSNNVCHNLKRFCSLKNIPAVTLF